MGREPPKKKKQAIKWSAWTLAPSNVIRGGVLQHHQEFEKIPQKSTLKMLQLFKNPELSIEILNLLRKLWNVCYWKVHLKFQKFEDFFIANSNPRLNEISFRIVLLLLDVKSRRKKFLHLVSWQKITTKTWSNSLKWFFCWRSWIDLSQKFGLIVGGFFFGILSVFGICSLQKLNH